MLNRNMSVSENKLAPGDESCKAEMKILLILKEQKLS